MFNAHTRHSYYYYTRIANQSPGIGTTTATEGFLPTPIDEINLYKEEVTQRSLKDWIRSNGTSELS